MADGSVYRTELEDYQPPTSLWALIQQHVAHHHEQEEVKRILGESLVDQSVELHDEVRTLLCILEEMRDAPPEPPEPRPSLPEPPHVRHRLVQEICFFVENVRDKALQQGLDPYKLLSRHNSAVIHYATDSSRVNSRIDGRPSSSMSSHSTRASQDPSVCDDVQSMSDKFNYLQLDDVLNSLRGHLEEEVERLLGDITYLQECLDAEMQLQTRPLLASPCQPSLTELKEERAALEKELLTADPVLPLTPPKHRPVFKPLPPNKHSRQVAGGQLKALSHEGNTSGPMKAVHNMAGVSPAGEGEQCTLGYRTPSQVSLRDIAIVEKSSRHRSRTLSPSRVKVVSVSNIMSPDRTDYSCTFVPSPPPPASTPSARPSSADRFRQRVLQCRDAS